MSIHPKLTASFAYIVVACLMTTSASAASLPCVQRAINWNNASSLNYVTFALVALHENSAGAYASGWLLNSYCNRLPYAGGTVSCLVSSRTVDAVLLQPQLPNSSLRLTVDVIPSDTLAQVHLRQPNATYDFDPVCVGNFLVGGDQYGNRWTISFGLKQGTVIR